MEATNETKRAAFYAIITPYLDRIYENAPEFGSVGLTLVFHESQITRIDISETVQRKIVPHAVRGGAQ